MCEKTVAIKVVYICFLTTFHIKASHTFFFEHSKRREWELNIISIWRNIAYINSSVILKQGIWFPVDRVRRMTWRFRLLESDGITILKELIEVLKSNQRIEQFSKETGLSIQYLTLLNRGAKSYLHKPIRLDKFPGYRTQLLWNWKRLESRIPAICSTQPKTK